MATKEKKELPRLKSVYRFSKLPVVESGYQYASVVYMKIKNSNALIRWGLGNMEGSFYMVFDKSRSVPFIEMPLSIVDGIVCKGLDQFEQRVPAITYPTELLVNATKDYVTSTFIQPVVKRADSVKQLSLNGATKYKELAATRLDNALDVADKYVDKYLPDTTDSVDSKDKDVSNNKTIAAIKHANRLSRKLKRRLTRRTVAEAKALKQQSVDTVQSILYLADLLIRDPKQFVEKVQAVWANLSEDEPENQLPPANLEQLIAMITREMARRFVHLTNFTVTKVGQTPQFTIHTIQVIAHQVNYLLDYTLKIVHLEGAKDYAVTAAKVQLRRTNEGFQQLLNFANNILEALVSQLAFTNRNDIIPLEHLKTDGSKVKSNPNSVQPLMTKNQETNKQNLSNDVAPTTENSPKAPASQNPINVPSEKSTNFPASNGEIAQTK